MFGCVATFGQLERRVQFDLDCPADKITFTKMDSRTVGVSGCGKKAVYVEDCKNGSFWDNNPCTWVLEGSYSEKKNIK